MLPYVRLSKKSQAAQGLPPLKSLKRCHTFDFQRSLKVTSLQMSTLAVASCHTFDFQRSLKQYKVAYAHVNQLPYVRLSKKSQEEGWIVVLTCKRGQVAIRSTFKEVSSVSWSTRSTRGGELPYVRLSKKSQDWCPEISLWYQDKLPYVRLSKKSQVLRPLRPWDWELVAIRSTFKEVSSFDVFITNGYGGFKVAIRSTFKEVSRKEEALSWKEATSCHTFDFQRSLKQ